MAAAADGALDPPLSELVVACSEGLSAAVAAGVLGWLAFLPAGLPVGEAPATACGVLAMPLLVLASGVTVEETDVGLAGGFGLAAARVTP